MKNNYLINRQYGNILMMFLLVYSKLEFTHGSYIRKNDTDNKFIISKLTENFSENNKSNPMAIITTKLLIAKNNKNYFETENKNFNKTKLNVIMAKNNNITKNISTKYKIRHNLTKNTTHNKKYAAKHSRVKDDSNNEIIQNEDDFDYDYNDDISDNDNDDETDYQLITMTVVLFMVEVYGTFYGLSYGIYSQANYFYHIYVIGDREPEHLGSLNNQNITIANP